MGQGSERRSGEVSGDLKGAGEGPGEEERGGWWGGGAVPTQWLRKLCLIPKPVSGRLLVPSQCPGPLPNHQLDCSYTPIGVTVRFMSAFCIKQQPQKSKTQPWFWSPQYAQHQIQGTGTEKMSSNYLPSE